jgi:hypothetical protein
MHATEAQTAQMNTSQTHAAQPAKAHAAEASTAKMHAATTEVAASTNSSEPSRLRVRGDAKCQCRR